MPESSSREHPEGTRRSRAESNWRENDAAWYEQRMLYCDLCGRMIAKRYLHAEIEDEVRTFCSEGCEELYRDYWLVERGPGYRRPDDAHQLYVERMTK